MILYGSNVCRHGTVKGSPCRWCLTGTEPPTWPWVERFDRLECRTCGAAYDDSHRPDCSEVAS